jgi:hypothetical protein
MGACSAKLQLSNDVYLQLKANPQSSGLGPILQLQLYYEMYDVASQKMIDEVAQIALVSNGAQPSIVFSNGPKAQLVDPNGLKIDVSQ